MIKQKNRIDPTINVDDLIDWVCNYAILYASYCNTRGSRTSFHWIPVDGTFVISKDGVFLKEFHSFPSAVDFYNNLVGK